MSIEIEVYYWFWSIWAGVSIIALWYIFKNAPKKW